MSLHNSIFFREPVNYEPRRVKRHNASVLISEMTDNDYDTGSTESDIAIDIRRGTAASKVDAVFVKYTGTLTQYVATPSGGSGAAFTRPVPTTLTNKEGTPVSLQVEGFTHDLYLVPGNVTGTSLRMVFTGTNLRIVALMVLEEIGQINANRDWARIRPSFVDRSAQVRQNFQGQVRRYYGMVKVRPKWEYEYTLISRAGVQDVLYREFLGWMQKYPNFCFAREFSRYPEEVVLATFQPLRVAIEPRSNVFKGAGDRMPFRIVEQ